MMATYTEATIQQSTGEIRKWTADFTLDLPTSVTVSSGTAVHTPPSGTAATATITNSTTSVTAQVGPLSVTGVHYLDIQATFSNGEKSEVRIAFVVNYPSATCRVGMVNLVSTIRGYTDAGVNDFSIAGVPYWSDAQLQTVLDRHRADIVREEASPVESYNNGTVVYLEYRLGYGNLEQGTTYFELEDAAGTTLGTALYTADYARGIVTFASDTTGSAVFLTGRSYDLNGAAADIWRMKAANAAKMYDFSTDNHRLSRSQFMKHCFEMAQYYEGFAAPSVAMIYREDNVL